MGNYLILSGWQSRSMNSPSFGRSTVLDCRQKVSDTCSPVPCGILHIFSRMVVHFNGDQWAVYRTSMALLPWSAQPRPFSLAEDSGTTVLYSKVQRSTSLLGINKLGGSQPSDVSRLSTVQLIVIGHAHLHLQSWMLCLDFKATCGDRFVRLPILLTSRQSLDEWTSRRRCRVSRKQPF